MPDGVLQWIDPVSGRGVVVRGGHVYATSSGDIEPVARHAGAHVHFDIRRHSHHQRRYGTLTGARRSDTNASGEDALLERLPDAVQRLDADGEPFVFFANAATGRGNVVYRRYDGQYGLITPAER